jgi:hypothetical protein
LLGSAESHKRLAPGEGLAVGRWGLSLNGLLGASPSRNGTYHAPLFVLAGHVCYGAFRGSGTRDRGNDASLHHVHEFHGSGQHLVTPSFYSVRARIVERYPWDSTTDKIPLLMLVVIRMVAPCPGRGLKQGEVAKVDIEGPLNLPKDWQGTLC